MKVTRKLHKITYGLIIRGNLFERDGEIFMKTYPIDNSLAKSNCVNIKNGNHNFLRLDDSVIGIEAELIVSCQ